MKNLKTPEVVSPATDSEIPQKAPGIAPVNASMPKKKHFGILIFLVAGYAFLHNGNWLVGGFIILITILIILSLVLPKTDSFSRQVIGIPALQLFLIFFGTIIALGLSGYLGDGAGPYPYAYLGNRFGYGALVIDVLSPIFVFIILSRKSGPRYRKIKRASCVVPLGILVVFTALVLKH